MHHVRSKRPHEHYPCTEYHTPHITNCGTVAEEGLRTELPEIPVGVGAEVRCRGKAVVGDPVAVEARCDIAVRTEAHTGAT